MAVFIMENKIVSIGDSRDEPELAGKPNGSRKRQVTMRLNIDVVDHFKAQAKETGIPYQSLINLYLQDCVKHNRKLDMNWLDH